MNTKKSPLCPVDKSELKTDTANSILSCPKCRRAYYANLDYDNKQQEEMNEYDDIETVSSSNYGSGAGPLLLSSALTIKMILCLNQKLSKMISMKIC